MTAVEAALADLLEVVVALRVVPSIIRITRELPLPIDEAYAWLTDYQEDDPQRANGVLIAKRKILARSATLVRMEGEHRAFGRVIPSVYEVTLSPAEHAWVSCVVEGPRTGSVTTYRLTRASARAKAKARDDAPTRLDVRYDMVHEDFSGRIILRLAKPIVRRNLVKMWEGYEAAMKNDLASPR